MLEGGERLETCRGVADTSFTDPGCTLTELDVMMGRVYTSLQGCTSSARQKYVYI